MRVSFNDGFGNVVATLSGPAADHSTPTVVGDGNWDCTGVRAQTNGVRWTLSA